MDNKQLNFFLAIVEYENITKASQKLHIAQPYLSQQLKLLEEELGVKLIERTTRKIQLTDAGHMLEHRARQILQLTETTIKELRDFNEGFRGTLTIGTIASSGDILLPEYIDNFHKKFPYINFEIRECSTHHILELLESGVIEIGIIRSPLKLDTYEAIYLENQPMIAVTSDTSISNNTNKYILLNDLENKPILVHRRFEKMIIEACEKSGFTPRILCKIEDTRAILLLAETGMGIAVIPKDWIDLAPSHNLKFREINEPSLATRTAIIWVKNRYLSVPARNFLKSFDDYKK
ncbi:MAG: LysR family transcriptional regulator [Bacillota bacterium]|nr:LysR family transcriptional regulator [Bacillota bacterium]